MSLIKIEARFRDLIPPPTAEERAGLETSLEAEGCRDPLVLWGEILIDGHNRFEICTRRGFDFRTVQGPSFEDEDEAAAWIIRNQFARRNLTPFARAELALALQDLIASRARSQQGRRTDLTAETLRPVDTRAELSKVAGVSHGTLDKARLIAAKASPEAKERLRRGESSIDAEAKLIRKHDRREERLESLAETAKGNAPLPTGRSAASYPVIYADPPWRYDAGTTDDTRVIENHYPTMSLPEICALGSDIQALATDDAVLFMWTTAPMLEDAFFVLHAWGFRYKSHMIWRKPGLGMGYWARISHELLIIALRGNPPLPPSSALVDSVQNAPRTEHSAKPRVFAEIIERMYPTLPKIELFCRSPRPGWDVWGNEAGG